MTDWKLGSLIWTESQMRLEFPILIHVLTLLNLGSTPLTDRFTFTFQVETIIIGNSMSKITTWCWMILHEVNNTSVNTFVCVQKWRVSVLLCWTTTQNFQSNFLTWDFPLLLLSKPWGSGLLHTILKGPFLPQSRFWQNLFCKNSPTLTCRFLLIKEGNADFGTKKNGLLEQCVPMTERKKGSFIIFPFLQTKSRGS